VNDLHPYDNVERRFHHTTNEWKGGLEVVARLLRLPHPPHSDGTLYDLSFYSGGIGVVDQLAITLGAGPALWAHVIDSFRAVTPEAGSRDAFYAEDFNWLLTQEENVVATRSDAIRFINAERRSFQRACVLTDLILFEQGSNVNDWVVFWGDESVLNYIAYSQG
jgi:hypothetical protein